MMTHNQSASSLQISTPDVSAARVNDIINSKSPNIENYDDVDDYFREQKSKLDSTLNYLINSDFKKRNRGSPRFNKDQGDSTLKVPESVNENLKDFTDINRLHPGVLLDYLKKFNEFNKKILTCYEGLKTKYTELSSKVNKFDTEGINITQSTSSSISPQIESSSSTLPAHGSSIASVNENNKPNLNVNESSNNLEIKVDALEQKSYADLLLCNGDFVSELLNNDVVNLKQAISLKIADIVPEFKESDIAKINIINKNKSILKIELQSGSIKKRILFEARTKKPANIYFSEYLTSYRYKLYYELRQLRRKYNEHLITYVRDGALCYKLKFDENNKFKTISTYYELNMLKAHLDSIESSVKN